MYIKSQNIIKYPKLYYIKSLIRYPVGYEKISPATKQRLCVSALSGGFLRHLRAGLRFCRHTFTAPFCALDKRRAARRLPLLEQMLMVCCWNFYLSAWYDVYFVFLFFIWTKTTLRQIAIYTSQKIRNAAGGFTNKGYGAEEPENSTL